MLVGQVEGCTTKTVVKLTTTYCGAHEVASAFGHFLLSQKKCRGSSFFFVVEKMHYPKIA